MTANSPFFEFLELPIKQIWINFVNPVLKDRINIAGCKLSAF